MKPELLHILQHSLGCDKYGRTTYRGSDEGDGFFEFHRNRFVTEPTSDDGKLCQKLVGLGLMQDHGPQKLADGMHCYSVTRAGREAMLTHSPKAPVQSRGRGRYLAFLSARDAFPDLTFRDFLTQPRFNN